MKSKALKNIERERSYMWPELFPTFPSVFGRWNSFFTDFFSDIEKEVENVFCDLNLISELTDEGKFTVKVPMGTIDKDSFDINVSGRTLEISGEKDSHYVRYKRVFPYTINPDTVVATAKEGVLSVSLDNPVPKGIEAKKIKVLEDA